MHQLSRVLCLVALLSLASIAAADVRLPAIIGDHMVLQRGASVPVWGWATAGERVRITGVDGNCLTVEAVRSLPQD